VPAVVLLEHAVAEMPEPAADRTGPEPVCAVTRDGNERVATQVLRDMCRSEPPLESVQSTRLHPYPKIAFAIDLDGVDAVLGETGVHARGRRPVEVPHPVACSQPQATARILLDGTNGRFD